MLPKRRFVAAAADARYVRPDSGIFYASASRYVTFFHCASGSEGQVR